MYCIVQLLCLLVVHRLGSGDRTTRRYGQAKDPEKQSLTLYQAMAAFEGSAERFELTLSKNDSVKVVDKKDHGMYMYDV